jgi:hypothetical protein
MATWIQFIDDNNRLTYVNLEAVSVIMVDDKSQRISIWSGGIAFGLSRKKSPEAFQQVQDFLAGRTAQSK